MKQLLFLCLLLIPIATFSQKYDLPLRVQLGKCYQKFPLKEFDYNKKFRGSNWIEISCKLSSELEKRKIKITKKDSIELVRSKIKMIKYKEKLISLGYDLEPSEVLNGKLIIAHNNYIKKKKREKRKSIKNKIQ